MHSAIIAKFRFIMNVFHNTAGENILRYTEDNFTWRFVIFRLADLQRRQKYRIVAS